MKKGLEIEKYEYKLYFPNIWVSRVFHNQSDILNEKNKYVCRM